MSDTPQAAVPTGQDVFVNRNLRLDCITAIGFDMDYTLARYAREHLERLAHQLTLQKLVARGYPAAIAHLPYEPRFIIRGLVVDKALGNILKLDRHNHVCRVYHGTRLLTRPQKRQLYRREFIHFDPPRFARVDTLFSLPEVCLYASLVDFFDNAAGAAAPGATDYVRVFDDIRESIDEAHRDDSLKSIVRAHIEAYIEQDQQLAATLQHLRQNGRKLFLVTNSQGSYTQAVMSYLLPEQSPGVLRWTDYFDAIVVDANKPQFFVGSDKCTPIVLNGSDNCFSGGSLRALEEHLGVGGESVLYVGDHIYGDILRSKKTCLWRTALVVEELEDEILLAQQLAQEPGFAAPQPHSTADQRRQHDEAYAARFNKHWGMVFKENSCNSRFGEQVAQYACLYTSRVSNFLHYSTDHYFTAPPDRLPHEHVR